MKRLRNKDADVFKVKKKTWQGIISIVQEILLRCLWAVCLCGFPIFAAIVSSPRLEISKVCSCWTARMHRRVPLEKLPCLEALAYCLIADFSYGRTFTWKWEAMQICSSSAAKPSWPISDKCTPGNSETCELFVEKWCFKISSQWRICTCWCRLFRGLLRFADV